MYRVQYKTHNASQAWMTKGNYSSESEALGSASRIAGRYFMVRVINTIGFVIWSG